MVLALISPPTHQTHELKLLQRFFEEGLLFYHLRKPVASDSEIATYLHQVPDQFHPRIVLHHHHVLARDFQIKGVHHTESIRKSQHAGSLIMLKDSPAPVISTSFHEVSELTAHSLSPYVYAFIGPVMDSISKYSYKKKISLPQAAEKIKLLKQSTVKCKIFALGGITKEALAIICDYGFEGAGILGAVWQAKDPFVAFKEIQSEVNKLNHHH